MSVELTAFLFIFWYHASKKQNTSNAMAHIGSLIGCCAYITGQLSIVIIIYSRPRDRKTYQLHANKFTSRPLTVPSIHLNKIHIFLLSNPGNCKQAESDSNIQDKSNFCSTIFLSWFTSAHAPITILIITLSAL